MLVAVIAWFALSLVVLFAVLFTAARATPKPFHQGNSNRTARSCDADDVAGLTAAHASRA
jgi:hypothetical protein